MLTAKPGLKPLKEEKILMEIKPHPLAFYDLYFIWLTVMTVGLIFATVGDELTAYLGNPLAPVMGYLDWITHPSENPLIRRIDYLPKMELISGVVAPMDKFMKDYAPIGLWLSILAAIAVPISVLRIEFRWGPIIVLVGLLSVAITVATGIQPKYSYYVSMILSLVGMCFVEAYRKSHRFYITNMRIVTEATMITKKSNELSYDKINNIVMEKGLVGSLFGFGTIIPVTASGLGMGSDAASVSGGYAAAIGEGKFLGAQVTGERSIQVPRTRSMYALFGVREPEKVKDVISENMHAYVQAPYLMKMTKQLEDIKRGLPPQDKEDDGQNL